MSATPTPSQTVGPFFAFGLCDRPLNEIVRGGPLRIEGRVLDGSGAPVPDAMVEIWQADSHGAYREDFGWGRCGTDAEGRYVFTSIKPGAVDAQAAHVVVLVFARGLLKPVLTRMYFPDELANRSDPVLSALAEDERARLVAAQEGAALRFDIRLQGDGETPFFTL